MYKRVLNKLRGKNARRGYTMTELLTVIAIIAVVCAIAIPSVIAIRRSLTFRENNDYAKSVFMAAQANLTEMRSEGKLTPLAKASTHEYLVYKDGESIALNAEAEEMAEDAEGAEKTEDLASFPSDKQDDEEEYYFTTSRLADPTAFELLLPGTSIDSKVRDGNILIEYNPFTGNVYAVFYTQKDSYDLAVMYKNGELPRDDKNLKKNLMGYYDGSTIYSSELSAEDYKATLDFENGEEAVIKLSVPIPPEYVGRPDTFLKALDVTFTVEGKGPKGDGTLVLHAKESGESFFSKSLGAGGRMSECGIREGEAVITYVIDSLAENRSFANLSYNVPLTPAKAAARAAAEERGEISEEVTYAEFSDIPVTDIKSEENFEIYPGANVTISADVQFDAPGARTVCNVMVAPLDDPQEQNPMVASYREGESMTVANGRHLQNLNTLSHAITAELVANKGAVVALSDDIYWNRTVEYYNKEYGRGGTYTDETYSEAPTRALPYFVPITNDNLFGQACFLYLGEVNENDDAMQYVVKFVKDGLKEIVYSVASGINDVLDFFRIGVDVTVPKTWDEWLTYQSQVPTMTDEAVTTANYASINGKTNGVTHGIYYINVDTSKYDTGKQYYTKLDSKGNYCGNIQANVDKFAGVFGFVNTRVENINVVNPIVKGSSFNGTNNPAAGGLVGATGWNALLKNCGVYIDKYAEGYQAGKMLNLYAEENRYYSKSKNLDFYGVSGCGAVGGLVGYAKSHSTLSGELEGANVTEDHLAFYNCFAAVPVSGTMRGIIENGTRYFGTSGNSLKHYGYTNGVGGLVGNAELTNFYKCYASGDVYAEGIRTSTLRDDGAESTWLLSHLLDDITGLISNAMSNSKFDLPYNARISYGAGGLVGTSHGALYTNCFTAGDIYGKNQYSNYIDTRRASATVYRDEPVNAGCAGFVGVMCYGETLAYGSDYFGTENTGSIKFDQQSVFSSCYTAGLAKVNGRNLGTNDLQENFTGANARIKYDYSDTELFWNGNYYDVYAPLWYRGNTDANGAQTVTITKADGTSKRVTLEKLDINDYVYKDTYYISQYREPGSGSQTAAYTPDKIEPIASPVTYENLTKLHILQRGQTAEARKWIDSQLQSVKANNVNVWAEDAIAAELIGAVDIGLTEIKAGAPENYDFNQVYFGIFPNFVVNSNGNYRYEYDAFGQKGATIARLLLKQSIRTSEGEAMMTDRFKSWTKKDWPCVSAYNIEDKLNIFSYDPDKIAESYSAFVNTLGDLEYVYYGLYNNGFKTDAWGSATAERTHGYNMTAQGAVYPFSMFTDIDYYGNWPAKELSAGGIAYYEDYSGGKTGYYFDRDNTQDLDNSKTAVVVEDGYAILSPTSDKISVTINGSSYQLNEPDAQKQIGSNSYYVFRLPYEALTKGSTTEFYTELSVAMNGKNFTFYFNPNTALSHVNPVNTGDDNAATTAIKPASAPSTIYIRTARQLRAMQNMQNFWTKGYTYLQMLNIDDSAYTGNKLPFVSIGSSGTPFNATYTGFGGFADGNASISNLATTTPVFGVIGADGRVENLTVNATASYDSAVLAAENCGNINKVEIDAAAAVAFGNNGAFIASENKGGVISGSTVKAADVTVNGSTFGAILGIGNKAGANGTVEDCTVTVGNISARSGSTVGGAFGKLNYTAAENINVTIGGISGAKYAGGVAGSVNNATIGGTADVNGNISASDAAGGFVGCGEAASRLSEVTVNIGEAATISAAYAGGIVGDAASLSAQNGTVRLNGSISGTTCAGGAAGRLVGGTFDAVAAELNKGTINGSTAAGFAGVCASASNCSVYSDGAAITGTTKAAGFAGELTGSAYNSSVTGTITIRSDNGKAAGFAVDLTGAASNCRVDPVRLDGFTGSEASVEELKNTFLKSDYSEFSIIGATAAGFAVDVTGATITSCDAVAAVSGTRDAAGFIVNLNNGSSVTTSYANTEVNGAAFIKNCTDAAGANVTNCYAWFGAEGSFDACHTYKTSYMASRTVRTGANLAVYTFENGTPVYKTSDSLYQIPVEQMNIDSSGTVLATGGVWKPAAADKAYPFDENITPPEYMYPMLRSHYGDWRQPPSFSYGVAYYELTDDGQIHVELWDMNTDTSGKGISCGLPGYTEGEGSFALDTIDNGNDQKILATGYAVFYENPSQIQTVGGDPYVEDPNKELLRSMSAYTAQCNGEISLDLTGLTFGAGSRQAPVDSDAFSEKYKFYTISENAEYTPVQALVVKGINSAKDADGHDTNRLSILPGFAREAYDTVKGRDNVPYEVRTGNQFVWIGTQSDKSIRQTHDLSLDGENDNIGRYTGGTASFTGTYTGVAAAVRHTIEVSDLTNAIFCNVAGGSGSKGGYIHDVKLVGAPDKLTGTAKDLASAGLLANEISGNATISNIELENCTMLYCNGAAKDASFGLVAGKVTDSTISKITVNMANVSYDETAGSSNGSINVGTVVGLAEKSTLECINVTGKAVRVLGNDPGVVEYDYVTGISYETDDVKNNAVNIGGIVGSMVNSELAKGNTAADTNSVTNYEVAYRDNAKGQGKTELKNYVNVGGAVGAATGTEKTKSCVKNIDVVGTTVDVNSKAPVQNERDKDGGRIFSTVFNVAGIVGTAQGYTDVDGSVSSYKIENDETTEKDDEIISSTVNTDVIYGIVYSGGLAGYVEEHSTVGGHKEADVKYPSVVSDVHFTTLADYSGGVHVGSAVGALDGTLAYCDISSTVVDVECSKEGYTPVGGAVGQTNPTGNLSNTTAESVSISAKSCNQDVIVGGLVGLATAGSTVSGTVTDPQFGELLVLENGHDTDIYVGGLVGDARGTIKNSSVNIGEMTVDISDDSVSDNRISDGVNHVHELFVGGLAGKTDVAEISEGSVFKCDVSAEKITVIKGSHDTEVNIGGAVGKNVEGLITNINQEGASANKVNIDYKPNGSKDKVDIGGLIGEMQSSKTNGGGLGSANISGEITLNGDTKLTGNYTVGGAIGTENNGGASYTNVTATVKIDKDWAGTTTDRHNSPAQLGKVGKFVGYADNGKFKNCNGNGTDDDSNVKYQFLGEVFANAPQISSGLYAAKNGSGTLQNLTGTITARSATNGGTPMYGDISFTPADTSTKIYSYNLTLDNCHYLTGGADKLQTIGQDKWFYGASKYNEKVDQYHLEKATSISSSSEYLICEGNDAMTARKQTADRFTTASIAQYADGSSFDNSKYNALANSIWHITGNGSYFTASKVVNKGVSDYDLRYIATTDNINFHLGIGGTSKEPTIRYNSDTGLWAIYHAWDYLDWFTRTYCAGHLKINGDSSVKKTTDKSKADSIIVYDKTIYEVIHSNDYESVFSPSAICYIIN